MEATRCKNGLGSWRREETQSCSSTSLLHHNTPSPPWQTFITCTNTLWNRNGSSHHEEGLPAYMPCCSEPAPSKTQIESLQLLSRLFRNTISSLCFSGFFLGQFLRSGMLMKASPLNRCFTKDDYGIKKAAPFLSMYCRREPVYLELIVRIKGRRGTSFFCYLQTIKKEQWLALVRFVTISSIYPSTPLYLPMSSMLVTVLFFVISDISAALQFITRRKHDALL